MYILNILLSVPNICPHPSHLNILSWAQGTINALRVYINNSPVVFGILEWNKDMEILVFSLCDTFIEQWALITFLSNHMLFHQSPVLRSPSFCRILSRQNDWEARFRLSYVRERTLENVSDQENLTLEKKEVRLGSGGEEGRENLQLGLGLTSLPSPNPSSYTFTLSLTSPILCKDMQKTNTYKPQIQKLKQQ